jgi:malate dehydrogenase (oxaloacetate-decarboxylating)(NADP+)
MKMATAKCLANLVKKPLPDSIKKSMEERGKATEYGPEYIIPNPFDPRLVQELPVAIVKAAVESGVAQ